MILSVMHALAVRRRIAAEEFLRAARVALEEGRVEERKSRGRRRRQRYIRTVKDPRCTACRY